MEGLRRPFLVAEVGSNHNGSIDRALTLIDAAALAGFSAVKFQHFRLGRLFSPWALEHHPELLERARYELPWRTLALLSECAYSKRLAFGCTFFDGEGLAVESQVCEFLKVSSYSLLDLPFLERVGQASWPRKPVILSTGMATLDEVQEAVDALRQGGCQDLTLLHCVSLYPTRPEEANLRAIQTLKEAFPGCKVGWSDHTVDPDVIHRAVALGAETIELHFDLDDWKGAEEGHSWWPGRVRHLNWREPKTEQWQERIDGTGIKAPQPRELPERLWRADPSDGLRPLKEARR